MRTYGRIKNPNPPLDTGSIGSFVIGVSAIGEAHDPSQDSVWVEVDTDPNGFDDAVMLTTVIQTLKLNLGESPFYGNYGIPARLSVEQQLPPDFYAVRTQQQYAKNFASLIVNRSELADEPTYSVAVTLQSGARLPSFGVAT